MQQYLLIKFPMSHLLALTDIARIRIQAEFEDIYSKTNKFIQTSTVHENKNEVELATLRDELKKFCDDCCGKFEEKLIGLQSMLYNFDQLQIKEDICAIGNLKKNNSEFYQHLTIMLPHTIVSARLINKIRGVINATIAQINYINAQNNYINAQNNYTIEEVEFSLVLTDTPEDTCTSFVYTLKCSKCDKYYVGRTHYGEQECYNEITTNTTSAVYEHIKDTKHTFKIDDMQKVFPCCENNKLKILESLLIKRYIVRDIRFLNICVMKELTLFQYNEDEIGKARSQLTVNTDRLGDARNKYTHILEFDFKEPSDNGKSACENDTKTHFTSSRI